MYNSSALASLAREMNEEMAAQSSMAIGKVVMHPNGYKVKVTSGKYLDSIYGCVSNFWYWRRVNDDGSLGEEEHGYGW